MQRSHVLESDLAAILERTEDLWRGLKGERVFITGGTGFIGCWLLESALFASRALNLGVQICALSRDPSAFRSRNPYLGNAPELSFVHGGVTDFSFPGGSFAHVIHAASELSSSNPPDPVGMLKTALLGTERVMDFASRASAQRCLFVSSGAVYGPNISSEHKRAEDDLLTQTPLSPAGAYGESKRIAELTSVMMAQGNGFEATIARGFTFLGPYLDLDSHFAAAAFLKAALNGQAITIEGHGRTVRSYLYAADMACWLWTILFRGRSGCSYNLGSDVPVSIAELAGVITRIARVPAAPVVRGKYQAGERIDYYVPEIARAREELGLSVFTSLEGAVTRTLQYHQN